MRNYTSECVKLIASSGREYSTFRNIHISIKLLKLNAATELLF